MEITNLADVCCAKCGKTRKEAVIGRFGNMWLCGEHIQQIQEKIDFEKQRILEE